MAPRRIPDTDQTLARPLRALIRRLRFIRAPLVDIAEVNLAASCLLRLWDIEAPPHRTHNEAVYAIEDRIALLLTMDEALEVLICRQYDPLVRACYDDLHGQLTRLLIEARAQRYAVQVGRFAKEPVCA